MLFPIIINLICAKSHLIIDRCLGRTSDTTEHEKTVQIILQQFSAVQYIFLSNTNNLK